MDRVFIKLYVPMLEKVYNVWIPAHKKIYNIIILLTKAINEINEGYYRPKRMPELYDKLTAERFDINITIKESTIRNGTELILI